MNNNEITNGLAAITMACDAYRSLAKDVESVTELESKTADVIRQMCIENEALCKGAGISNSDSDDGILIGACNIPLSGSFVIDSVIKQQIPGLIEDDRIVLPVKVDPDYAFTMVIELTGKPDVASELSQYLLISTMSRKPNLNFRCADMLKGGGFFSVIHDAIFAFPSKSGGKVYQSSQEFSELINDIEEASTSAIAALGHKYSSTAAYNAENQVKLTEYLNILYIQQSDYSNSDLKRLKIITENSRKNGISSIIVTDRSITEQFSEVADYYLRAGDKSLSFGYRQALPFDLDPSVQIAQDVMDSVNEGLQRNEKIDTVYAHHPELKTEPMSMDSSSAIRIPFAIDKNGIMQYFEIGGEAPPHALVSGSTVWSYPPLRMKTICR